VDQSIFPAIRHAADMQRARSLLLVSLIVAWAAAVAACSEGASRDPSAPEAVNAKFESPELERSQQSAQLPSLVPYRGLMSGIIETSAFDVFTFATIDRNLAEDDWTSAGMAAVNIIAASTLLTMPSTGQADAPRLADPEWARMAEDMQSAGVFVIMAVQRRDREGLARMADLLADTCKSCHDRFRAPPPKSVRDFAVRNNEPQ
jgi:cytochrome c556